MLNKLYERKAALEAALHTVSYQIDNLQAHFSKPQIRVWKITRRNLNEKLKLVNRHIRLIEKPKKVSTYTSADYLNSLIQKSRNETS